MTEQVLTDATVLLGGYDLTAAMNAIGLEYAADLHDVSTFQDATRTRIGGLKSVMAQHEGFWQGGDGLVDDVLFDNMGAGLLMTVSPNLAADGDRAFFFKCLTSEYKPGAAHGDVLAFSVSAEADGDLIRGTILTNKSAVSASAAAAGQNLGAVSASQYLYAGLHVLAISGTSPTLDVTIESDATNSFAGGETTRVTFTQATAVGSQWATPVAGAITDEWWRVSFTIGGTDPSISFVVPFGIQ